MWDFICDIFGNEEGILSRFSGNTSKSKFYIAFKRFIYFKAPFPNKFLHPDTHTKLNQLVMIIKIYQNILKTIW